MGLKNIIIDRINLLVFLHEGQQEVHGALELLAREGGRAVSILLGREVSDNVAQNVVDGIVGSLGQFDEEELGRLADGLAGIVETQHDMRDLTLDLDHVVEDQVGHHHQCVVAHCLTGISQSNDNRCGLMREFELFN